MTPEELVKELESGTVRPAYLVAGDEPLLRDDALAAIRRVVLAGAPQDFNLDRLAGEATSPGALGDAVQTLPVLAERRLVILTEPVQSRGAGRALADELPGVVTWIKGQSQTVLVVAAARADRRARWVKAFADPAAHVVCDPPRRRSDVAAFVRREAERQGVALERGVPELLAERVGPQLLLLRQEIAKLGLFAGPESRVTRDHVLAASTDVAEQPIWDLTDAIGEGRAGEALAILGSLLRGGAPSPVVLASLASHFRRLTRVRSGGRVPGPPFVVRKLEQQAGRYSAPRLVACLGAIHQTDLALKGASAMPPDLALERLVLGLAT